MKKLLVGLAMGASLFLVGCSGTQNQEEVYQEIAAAVETMDTLEEVVEWKNSNDIQWGIRNENGERATQEFIDVINRIGLENALKHSSWDGTFLGVEAAMNPETGNAFVKIHIQEEGGTPYITPRIDRLSPTREMRQHGLTHRTVQNIIEASGNVLTVEDVIQAHEMAAETGDNVNELLVMMTIVAGGLK